jgi:hypothetical protein
MWFRQSGDTPALARSFDSILLGRFTGVRTIFGDEPVGDNLRHGGRLTLGRYLGDSAIRFEGRLWGLEDGSERFVVTSGDLPRLTRPIIDAASGLPLTALLSQPGTVIISAPGVATNGSIDILSKNDFFGADAWLRRTWWNDGRFQLDLLAGYSFVRLDDLLQIETDSTRFSDGRRFQVRDTFATQNEFHGGSLGVVADWRHRALSLEALGRISFGQMRERVVIDGRTLVTPALGGVSQFSSGVLAGPSNIGVDEAFRFAVVPELNLNAVIHISPAWRITGGYSLLYLSEAILAGEQIDRRVNLSRLAGSTTAPSSIDRPALVRRETTLVIQGMSLGLDYRW